jgi:hypothetical protein
MQIILKDNAFFIFQQPTETLPVNNMFFNLLHNESRNIFLLFYSPKNGVLAKAVN